MRAKDIFFKHKLERVHLQLMLTVGNSERCTSVRRQVIQEGRSEMQEGKNSKEGGKRMGKSK